ncbi:MAG: DUF1819 family protein [Muribaculaceae bacterium]|nr:DUF1819 family protein [Muribaculaceae bacterium]
MAKSHAKYNSTVNVVGSIPDYSNMIDYINQNYGMTSSEDRFVFRTSKATYRFKKAVSDGFFCFTSEDHKTIFLQGLVSKEYSIEEKLIILFWQFIFCNNLFREATDNVFLRLLFSGRTSIEIYDVEAYLTHLKKNYPDEMPFSDSTLTTIASKYLTVLKKFGMAEGKVKKIIKAPHISSKLFVYLVRFALCAYPDYDTLDNPLFRFSFLDQQSIINRLKTIEYIPLWDITQIGNDITISLKK